MTLPEAAAVAGVGWVVGRPKPPRAGAVPVVATVDAAGTVEGVWNS